MPQSWLHSLCDIPVLYYSPSVLLRGCPSLISIALITTMTKSSSRRAGLIVSSRLQSMMQRSQGKNPEAGRGAEATEELCLVFLSIWSDQPNVISIVDQYGILWKRRHRTGELMFPCGITVKVQKQRASGGPCDIFLYQ